MPNPSWPVVGSVYRPKWSQQIVKRVTEIRDGRVHFVRLADGASEPEGRLNAEVFCDTHEPDPQHLLIAALEAWAAPGADPIACAEQGRVAIEAARKVESL